MDAIDKCMNKGTILLYTVLLNLLTVPLDYIPFSNNYIYRPVVILVQDVGVGLVWSN